MSRYCCVTAYVFSSCIRRFPDDSVTRNLTCIVGFHMTLHYVVAQSSRSFDWYKNNMLMILKKYRALENSPLILKLQVTFTKRLSFITTFKGHSIIMYLNHASTQGVINTQNQCQIWIYLKATCCVQQNIVL